MTSRIPPIFILLFFAIALLAIATPFTISQFLSSQDIQRRATSDLATCRELCKQIKELQTIVPAAQSDDSSVETSSRVRQGLIQAGIDENRLGEIKIMGRTAIPKTSFAREDAAVTLKPIELKSLFAFITALESAAGGVLCSGIDIRVAKSVDDDSPALWTPVLTLTQLRKLDKRASGAR